MREDYDLLKKRFLELYNKADRGGYFTFTDFLGLAEQSALRDALPRIRPSEMTLFGGADGAERVMARFGNAEEVGYETPFPILCVNVEPL